MVIMFVRWFPYTIAILFILVGLHGSYIQAHSPDHYSDPAYMPNGTLPPTLINQIKHKYGHFRIATRNDHCHKYRHPYRANLQNLRWSYGMVQNDFNGDGLTDYSLIIYTPRSHYIWLLAMGTRNLEQDYLVTDLSFPSVDHFNFSSHMHEGKMCEGTMILGFQGGIEGKNANPYFGLVASDRRVLLYWEKNQLIETGYAPPLLVDWYDPNPYGSK